MNWGVQADPKVTETVKACGIIVKYPYDDIKSLTAFLLL